MKTLAAVLVEQKKPLVLEEIEIPPLSVGQVLVKVLCSGICGSQLGEIDGVKGPDRFLPHLLGHEGTGIVQECGEGVSTVRPGDKAVLHWRKGAGLESLTPKYKSQMGMIHAGWVTTFNQYAVVSENRLTKIPADFDPEAGAILGCAATTAMGVINNDARLGIGESILVIGAGGIGLNVVQFAAMVSAHPIIAVDLYDHKLDLARQLGATHTINAKSGDLDAQVRKIVGAQGVDVAVENTGVADMIELAYNVTTGKGRVILVGVPNKSARHPAFYTLPLHFGKVVKGSEGGSCQPDVDIPKLVRLVQAGKLDLSGLVSKRYALEQINEAIEGLRLGRVAGRCMIKM